MIRLLFAAAVACAALAGAQPVAASPPSPQAAGASDQRRALELLVRAREDAGVQHAEAELEEATRSARRRLDPASAEREARARQLQEEAAAAREAGDADKLNLLAREADQLRTYFADLGRRAAEDPAVTAAKQRREGAMMARMTELDPEAPALLERVRGSLGR
jgi:hypothetical protein